MRGKLFFLMTFLISCVLSQSVFAGNGRGNSGKQGHMPNDADLETVFTGMEKEPLSSAETEGLLLIREEEKLARDVYLQLADLWGTPIFSNIGRSEQTHMDTMGALIDRYELEDPVTTDRRGEFVNPELAGLYTKLVNQGTSSLTDALKVGIMIEELDIDDIHQQLAVTDNQDIRVAYQNLIKGSRNHLRSFYSQIANSGESYKPQYLGSEEFDRIVSSPAETGGAITDPDYIY